MTPEDSNSRAALYLGKLIDGDFLCYVDNIKEAVGMAVLNLNRQNNEGGRGLVCEVSITQSLIGDRCRSIEISETSGHWDTPTYTVAEISVEEAEKYSYDAEAYSHQLVSNFTPARKITNG